MGLWGLCASGERLHVSFDILKKNGKHSVCCELIQSDTGVN